MSLACKVDQQQMHCQMKNDREVKMERGDADCEASDGDDGDDGRPPTATTTATVIAKVATRNKKEGLLRRKTQDCKEDKEDKQDEDEEDEEEWEEQRHRSKFDFRFRLFQWDESSAKCLWKKNKLVTRPPCPLNTLMFDVFHPQWSGVNWPFWGSRTPGHWPWIAHFKCASITTLRTLRAQLP